MSDKDPSESSEGHVSIDEQSDKEYSRSGSKRKKYSSDEDDEEDESEFDNEEEDLGQPSVVSNGMVEFSLTPVNALLVCKLCSGYYRDPYTIAECLHTFCKSCLFFAFSKGYHSCPDCNIDLGPDPFRTALSDRTIQELVDKVLFPRLQELDDVNEREFYSKRNIRLKPEFEEDDAVDRKENSHLRVIPSSVDDELNFTLIPEKVPENEYEMPALDRPCIRTSGRFKIVQLKKYILKQLQISAGDPSLIEILCNGLCVGNELSLVFVLRTIWLRPTEGLKLTYRFAEDYLC